jgi:formate dehydrogenase subunit gamma
MLWSLLIILVGAMVLPLSGYLYTALAQDGGGVGTGGASAGVEWNEDNPRTETWEAVRRGVSGYTAVPGQEAGVLIQNGGQNWRQLRNDGVASIMPWVMLASLVAIAAVFLLTGRHKLHEPRSGRVVLRWRLWERVLHWTVATLFIVLAITGLSILFGRAVLIPVLGTEGFAVWAGIAMNLHNYVGPVFTVCLAVMVLAWIWFNFPNRTDLQWFKAGGGFLKNRHAPAGKANGGEKVWFWIVFLLGGGLVCVSGLVLDFPNFGQSRETMQLANLIHGTAAILWIAIFFGHAYIGTLGTEGALEGMTTGYVSSEWARQHHDEWYEKVKDREVTEEEARSGRTAPSERAST